MIRNNINCEGNQPLFCSNNSCRNRGQPFFGVKYCKDCGSPLIVNNDIETDKEIYNDFLKTTYSPSVTCIREISKSDQFNTFEFKNQVKNLIYWVNERVIKTKENELTEKDDYFVLEIGNYAKRCVWCQSLNTALKHKGCLVNRRKCMDKAI